MRRLKTLAIVLGITLLIGEMSLVQAADSPIHVSVNGTELTCPSSPCYNAFPLSTATLPGGTKFTIADGALGQARVVADDAGGQDILKMENTVFAATGAFTNYSISFWREFVAPPSATGGNVSLYKRQANGAFKRGGGAPTNAYLTVNATVASQNIEGPVNKKVLCPSATCGQFSIVTTNPLLFAEGINALPAPRTIRGDITNFGLPQSSDKLDLVEFKIWSEAGAGADGSFIHSGVSHGKACKCEK